MFKNIKTLDELNKEKQIQINKERLVELKRLLTESDFKVLPDYDKPLESIIEDRQAWREEVRQIEDWLVQNGE